MTRRPIRRTARLSEAALDPSTGSLEYKELLPTWRKLEAVLGGTSTMRAAATEYLPQHEGESQKRYEKRLKVSIFTNYTKMTRNYWIGKPYSKPVTFTQETDPYIVNDFAKDVDLSGNDITVVTRDWFQKGIEKRIAYCLVEYPSLPPELQGRTVTKADEEKYNLRPYWCIIPAESMLSYVTVRRGGDNVVVHMRHYDNEVVYEGFEEKIKYRIREYNRTQVFGADGEQLPDVVTVTTWEMNDQKKWINTGTTTLTLDTITCVRFDTGEFELDNLADLNICHWQSSSDQRNCLTAARFPILAGSGVDTDTAVTIGPYEYLSAKDPQGMWYYVEHTGAALSAGDTDIEGLVADMAMYGAEMLKQRPDRQTATAAILDTSQATAPLQMQVHNFVACVNLALKYTMMWANIPDGVAQAVINTDFALTSEQTAQVDNLHNGYKSGAISHDQYINGLIELKALPPGFDKAANNTQLDADAQKKVDQALAMAQANAKPQDNQNNPPPKKG